MFTAPLSYQTALIQGNLKPAQRSQCLEKHLGVNPVSVQLASPLSGPHFGSSSPPKGKLPGWIKALAVAGLGLVGWGQLPNKPALFETAQVESVQPSQTENVGFVHPNVVFVNPKVNPEARVNPYPANLRTIYTEDLQPIRYYVGAGDTQKDILPFYLVPFYLPDLNFNTLIKPESVSLYQEATRNVVKQRTAQELSGIDKFELSRLIDAEVINLQRNAEAQDIQANPQQGNSQQAEATQAKKLESNSVLDTAPLGTSELSRSTHSDPDAFKPEKAPREYGSGKLSH